MNRLFITGDTHGDFYRIYEFSRKFETTLEDVLVILGDAGLNYYLNIRDKKNKDFLKDLNLTLFLIKGNHEKYPENLPNYKIKTWNDGEVFFEEEYPNLIFAKDGEVYNFNGKSVLVIGGAYSVDKYYRLQRGYSWFEDEQPSDELKEKINKMILTRNSFDFVFTHTCPINVMPRHLFLSFVDQSTVDNSTENWLQYVADNISFERWFYGHYHGEWKIDKYTLMFENYEQLL